MNYFDLTRRAQTCSAKTFGKLLATFNNPTERDILRNITEGRTFSGMSGGLHDWEPHFNEKADPVLHKAAKKKLYAAFEKARQRAVLGSVVGHKRKYGAPSRRSR